MNSSTRSEIRDVLVGVAVTVILIAILGLVFGPSSFAGGATYRVQASFGQTDGLSPGSPVQAAGVTVGEVVSLELADGYRVRATLELDSDVVLDTDASVAIVTDGIFGAKLMQIDIGGGDENIENGGVIAFTEDAVVLDDLLSLIMSQARAKREAAKQENAQ